LSIKSFIALSSGGSRAQQQHLLGSREGLMMDGTTVVEMLEEEITW
jgi:hypothetical protein